jgi:hypothetical protein
MPTHALGGEQVAVAAKTSSYFWTRSDGVSIEVSPVRPWWCLWLCTSKTKVDSITCAITLTNRADPSVAPVTAQNTCTNCDSLDVMGPTRWGFPKPPDKIFNFITYQGSVTIRGIRFGFSGSFAF